VAAVDRFVADLAMRVESLSPEMARRAAALRARHARLRLPDALVLATADVLDAARVLTADRAWPMMSRRARTL
jgi:predicted nucleic acid-binding protein